MPSRNSVQAPSQPTQQAVCRLQRPLDMACGLAPYPYSQSSRPQIGRPLGPLGSPGRVELHRPVWAWIHGVGQFQHELNVARPLSCGLRLYGLCFAVHYNS